MQPRQLGLVIIDEEQRFGVKQKETLKQLAADVDMLCLSATPIPRTLHFSLLGLRKISVLAEPPAQRRAISTRVAPWDNSLIKQAIEQELARDGQVFVIHNRVQDIDDIAHRLARLVPEMSYEVLHGQLGEQAIANAMARFKAGQIQVLIATSIVESGLDIPNANTLIVSEAHMFGLAELHQIRGRIGRFSRQAYAYFLTPRNRPINAQARERLAAIEEYADLGAGFKLALRDLEIRGAGNLLGAEQSGHIDSVGYELYCRLLADAIRAAGLGDAQLGPGAALLGRGCSLAFPIDAFIPDAYLEQPALKFELHKQLDNCRRQQDIAALATGTSDRYGSMPDAVRRLFQARTIRLAADQHHIRRIEIQDRQMRLHLGDGLPEIFNQAAAPDSTKNAHHSTIVHIQPQGDVLVLFLNRELSVEQRLEFLSWLFRLD